MPITKVSASKLESYAMCPYQYYIKYVQQKAKSGATTDSMHFGTMVHDIMKDFHAWVKANPLPPEPDNMKRAIYYKVMTIIQQKMIQYKSAIGNRPVTAHSIYNDHIAIYLQYFMEKGFYAKNMEGERDFSISIGEVAATIERKDLLSPLVEKYKHVLLVGKIDLVVYPDLVIDFKTQGKKSFMKSFVSNFQSIMYTLIFPRDMIFVFMFLWKTLETVEVRLSADTRPDKLNMIAELIDRIESSQHYNANQKSCRKCIFKALCPHKKQ